MGLEPSNLQTIRSFCIAGGAPRRRAGPGVEEKGLAVRASWAKAAEGFTISANC